jgi:hypothetical protein
VKEKRGSLFAARRIVYFIPVSQSAILRSALISARGNLRARKNRKQKSEIGKVCGVESFISLKVCVSRRLKSNEAAFGWRKIDARAEKERERGKILPWLVVHKFSNVLGIFYIPEQKRIG